MKANRRFISKSSAITFLCLILFLAFNISSFGLPTSSVNTVYPRVITPNGDGINDLVFFLFDNPTDAPIKGSIYDLRAAKIADTKRSDLFAGPNSVMTWDGKDDSGSVVAGGVYLYKVEVGEKTFTGSVSVAR